MLLWRPWYLHYRTDRRSMFHVLFFPNCHFSRNRYAVHCTKLSAVREVSRTLARCHMLLNENIDMMEALNTSLPADVRLEPFVWTTG